MKAFIKPLTLLFFLLLYTQLSAKDVFPTDGAMWRTVYISEFDCDEQGGIIYELKGDTLFDNKLYSKLYQKEWINFYWGAFRIEGDSVWYRDVKLNKDHLLYDFSLEVGDTITLNDFLSYIRDYPFNDDRGESMVWQAKVTERFYDNDNLLHIKLEHTSNSDMRSFYQYDEWVEGIGSLLYGPVDGYLGFAYAVGGGQTRTEQQLACFKNGDQEVFKLCKTCFGTPPTPPSSLSENELLFHLSIHNGSLQLKSTSSDLPALIDLFDPTGKVIFSQIISDQQTSFNLSHLPKGVLMYQITPLEGKRETGKVMNR